MSKHLLPLALKGIGLLSLAGGALLGAKSANDIKSANDCIEEAAATYEEAYQDLKVHEESVNEELQRLGGWQEYAIHLNGNMGR